MANTKDIRRRIKSINSTCQITKAMELVSAAKMRRAQQQAFATRTYSRLAWELLQNLSSKTHPKLHKLLRRPKEIKNIAIVLITSNRGLISGFNNNIINAALNYASHDANVEFIIMGKKGHDGVRKRGLKIVAEFEKRDTLLSVLDIRPMARLVINDFILGKYDKVVLVYMDFISTLSQKPRIIELLPLSSLQDLQDEEVEADSADSYEEIIEVSSYLYEPSADAVLEILLPRLIEMQIYQALLETNAAEHSARMVAMKNASDAALDLVSELTLEYNQLRQEAVTREMIEIVAGSLALIKH